MTAQRGDFVSPPASSPTDRRDADDAETCKRGGPVILLLADAERLAERARFALYAQMHRRGESTEPFYSDVARLDSDLAGLRQHAPWPSSPSLCGHCDGESATTLADCYDAQRYSAGILRTAAAYGVTP